MASEQGFSISIKVSGDKEVATRMKLIGASLNDWTDTMNRLGRILAKEYFQERVFTSQGGDLGVNGTPWRELANSTQRSKGRNYKQYATVPLIASGKLRKGFKFNAGPQSLEIFNDVETKSGINLLALHQYGTSNQGNATPVRVALSRALLGTGGGSSIGRGNNLPARPILVISDGVKQIAQDTIEHDVRQKIGVV